MSAFIVTDNTINALLGFADAYTLQKFHVGSLNEVGQILVDENYRSVNYRYKTDDKPHTYRYSRYTVKATDAAQHMDCYEYQACETPDWEITLAFRICAHLRRNICKRLVSESGAEYVWEALENIGMVESIA